MTVLDLPEPRALRADELLLDVRAAGVGNWDDFVRTGRGRWDVGETPPMALGVEAAGVVVSVGRAVTALAAGNDVVTHPLPLRDQGAWAERMIVPAASVGKKPASVSFAAAAVFPVPALTAEQVLAEALGARRGDSVLVNGAGGLTGGMIVQLAVAKGMSVTATAGPHSAERVRDYGADRVLDYHDPEWPEKARDLGPGGAGHPFVVNAAPGGAVHALAATATGGRLATITGDPPPAERDIVISAVLVHSDGAQLEVLSELLGEGRLSAPEPAVYDLDDAPRALAASVSGAGPAAIAL